VSQVNAQLLSSLLPQVQFQVPGIGNVFGGQSSPTKNVLGAQITFPWGGSASTQIVLSNATDNLLKTFQSLAGNISQGISKRINNTLNQIQSLFSSTPLAPFIQAGVQTAQQFSGLLQRIINFRQNVGSGLFNIPDISIFLNPPIISNFLNQSSFNPNFNLMPNLMRQQIQNALQQFGNVANLSVLQAITQIQSSLSDLQNSSQSIINGINDIANSSIISIQQNIQNLSRNGQLCVNNSGITPQIIIENARDDGINCVQLKIKQGLDIARNASSYVLNAYENIQNVTAELEKCGSFSVNVSSNAPPLLQTAQLACYGSALIDINSDTILLGFIIAERAAEAYNYLTSLQGYALKCAVQSGQKIAQQMLEASRVIAKCMLDG
jgi:ElaB/YqjD/DUF883 family membrane-anchored ribosome-binding protein